MSKAPIRSLLALSVLAALAACSDHDKGAQTAAAQPAASADAMPAPGANHPAAKPSAEVDLAGIVKPEGGLTVAEVFAQKDTLGGKSVIVLGKVVKLNTGIMDKDWLHVRDGSGADGTNDLTVTTTSKPLPKLGDIVTVTGPVTLNKDFGMGYQYPVILEGAEVKVETPAP